MRCSHSEGCKKLITRPSISLTAACLQVAICCFDKTGTLTSDNMMLEGLSGVPGAAEGLLREIRNAPKETQRVLACCQALIQVDGDLVGDPLERAALDAVGALFLECRCFECTKAKSGVWRAAGL